MNRSPLLFAFFVCVACSSMFAAGDDWLITPGKRVGQITIGMERGDVLRRLGTPQREDVLVNDDKESSAHYFKPSHRLPEESTRDSTENVFRDDWINAVPLDSGWLGDFVSVYFFKRRVVQIEVRPAKFKTAEGLSTADAAPKFRKTYSRYSQTFGKSDIFGSVIATKHFVMIEDAVEAGIAWRYGTTGNLAPDPSDTDPVEVIIIHAAGKEMVFDPDIDCRFLWKDNPEGRSTDS